MWMVIEILAFNHSVLDWVKKGSVYQYFFNYFIFLTLIGFLVACNPTNCSFSKNFFYFPNIPSQVKPCGAYVKQDLKYCLTCTMTFLIGILALC